MQNTFHNLAGQGLCDTLIRFELGEAGIPVQDAPPHASEVPYRVIGELNGFTFKRAWVYWTVKGPMPLSVARVLYENPVGRNDVRVAGHCGCPPPDQWCDLPDKPTEEAAKAKIDELGFAAFMAWAREADKEYRERVAATLGSGDVGELVVGSYHIDSPEGLALFAQAVRQLPH